MDTSFFSSSSRSIWVPTRRETIILAKSSGSPRP